LRGLEKVLESPAGRTFLLRRITFDIAPGEFITIMGPSGAGKSTLLAILGMFDGAWTGEYHFRGHPVHRLENKARLALNRRHIGFVFQQYHLLDDLTVAENLDVPLSYRNVPKDQRAAIVADTLDRFQIVGKKDLYPRQLSGGQQQQLVGAARVLAAARPALLRAGINPPATCRLPSAREIMDLFRQLNQAGNNDRAGQRIRKNAAVGNRVIGGFADGWVVEDRRTRVKGWKGERVGRDANFHPFTFHPPTLLMSRTSVRFAIHNLRPRSLIIARPTISLVVTRPGVRRLSTG
jgi:ABC-type lipoprotein export system ATPase subunit